MPTPQPSRRTVTRGAAWAVPVVVVAAAAPSMAASCDVEVTVVTPGLSSGGFDLFIRDGKNLNSNTNTDPGGTRQVLNMTFAVTVGGTPLTGASVTVTPDATLDAQGNRMIGFSPSSQTSGFGESATPKIASVTTGGTGQFVVKVSTATYGSGDCPFIPRSGTFTVTVAAPCATAVSVFTYQVWDASPMANCP